MNATDLIAKTLELNTQLVNMALDGLTDEDLKKQPNPDSNPIGWLLWHMTRAEDDLISRFTGKPQVWTEGKWHQRITAPGGPEDGGGGNTMEQVRAFRASRADLLAYAQAVRQNTLAALPQIPASALDREVKDAPIPVVKRAGDFLSVLLLDYSHHAGQICYLRGWLKGRGWLPF
ncbi:MAG: DinB family protein [Nitrospinota bacterium]